MVLAEGLDPAAAEQSAGAIAVAIGGTPTGTPGEFTGGLDDVAYAAPTLLPDGTTALVTVIPESGPQAEATSALVAQLRELAPELEAETGADLAVTGQTAVAIDVSDRLGSALLPFALVVVGLALVLLLLVFRSILVPIKAAVGFLLSVGASFGAVVAVFQWGWFGDLLGVPATGPVISFLPVILMAVLFGLAMDYEVFLVSRMREEYVHGASPREAVVTGARHAARVVVAAALIMFSVFASFVDHRGRHRQGHRLRSRGGHPGGRLPGADDARARRPGAARPVGLVAAPLAGPCAARPGRRGRPAGLGRAGAGARAGPR